MAKLQAWYRGPRSRWPSFVMCSENGAESAAPLFCLIRVGYWVLYSLQDDTGSEAAPRSSGQSQRFAGFWRYRQHRVAGCFGGKYLHFVVSCPGFVFQESPTLGRCHHLVSCAEDIEGKFEGQIFEAPTMPHLLKVPIFRRQLSTIDMSLQPKDMLKPGSYCGLEHDLALCCLIERVREKPFSWIRLSKTHTQPKQFFKQTTLNS